MGLINYQRTDSSAFNLGAYASPYSLEGFIVQLKQYLERCTNPRHLELSPKSALVATGAVEDSRDVSEVILELISKLLNECGAFRDDAHHKI